jgi:hypothetical protein
VPPRRISGSG